MRKGFASDAVDFFDYALKLQPSAAGAHVNLGMAYKEAGQTDRAIEELNRAIDLDPDFEGAYRSLGDIYLGRKDLVELRNTLQRYLKAMPNNLTAMKALEELNSKSEGH